MSSLRPVAVAAVLAGLAGPGLAAPVELLSHRAAYRLSLADARSASGLARVHGALVMEWRASCEGWISNQRLGFVAEAAEGPGFTYDVRFSSWESADNTRLRFSVRSFDNGGLAEEFRGQATLDALGGRGLVRYVEPAESVVELPAGTLFPTEHVRQLIAAARAGRTVVTHEVFDGSGPEALTRVSAVIGKPRAEPAAADGSASLRWPVSLAYHSVKSADATPEFELAFALGEDGVLHDVTLDYGDFRLEAELEQLDRFPPSRCD
jgi:hypothetical protein